MKFDNYMILEFPSKSCNEAFARSAVAAFAAQLDPTLEELGDIRTAVSEAVTNCIVHAYPDGFGMITVRCRILKDSILDIVIKDKGVGIADLLSGRKIGINIPVKQEKSIQKKWLFLPSGGEVNWIFVQKYEIPKN